MLTKFLNEEIINLSQEKLKPKIKETALEAFGSKCRIEKPK